MKSYIFTSESNYGTLTVIINAESKQEANELAKDHPHIWDGYTCIQLDIYSEGIVYNSAE